MEINTLQLRGLRRQAIDLQVSDALEIVGLLGLDRRLPHELSGGQQQRVALARAIVFRPNLLLMDEPLGALDKNMRQQMQLELGRLHKKLGVTIVYITHDQEEALAMADRVAVMRDGEIVQISSPNDLYVQPRYRFVAGFLGHCNFLPFDLLSREANAWSVAVDGFAGKVAPPDQDQAADMSALRLAVRPQYMEFAEEGIRATVLDAMFMGEMMDFQLALATGETVIVKRIAHAAGHPEVEAEVRLAWDWSKARVVR